MSESNTSTDNICKQLRSRRLTIMKMPKTKDSLLLSVPLKFYVDFFKTHYKSVLGYVLAIILLIFAYFYAPLYYSYNTGKLTHDLSLKQFEGKADSRYIQAYNPLIYDEMLKELRAMQQAAINLQEKQQAMDRKTTALQRQLYTLRGQAFEWAPTLNEARAREMIQTAFSVYDADKLGLRDFALETLGGSILSTPFTAANLSPTAYVLFGLIPLKSYSNPRVIIQTEVTPGNCFSFEGNSGKIRIRLSNEIFISAVTLEHVSRSLLTADEASSTPKNIQVKGLSTPNDSEGEIITEFIYSMEGPTRQTFLIAAPASARTFVFIELNILDNYGNERETCVYRFRVHGKI